jgi:hypothetical protein
MGQLYHGRSGFQPVKDAYHRNNLVLRPWYWTKGLTDRLPLFAARPEGETVFDIFTVQIQREPVVSESF